MKLSKETVVTVLKVLNSEKDWLEVELKNKTDDTAPKLQEQYNGVTSAIDEIEEQIAEKFLK